MEIAYSSTALVVQCGNAWADGVLAEQCGTFLEIHRKDDTFVIAETALPAGFVSGYKMWNLPLTYDNNPNNVLCRGHYEVNPTRRAHTRFRGPSLLRRMGATARCFVPRAFRVSRAQIWWTLRQPNSRLSYVEQKKRFYVSEPPCVWDAVLQRESDYADYAQAFDDTAVANDKWVQYLIFNAENARADRWTEIMSAAGSYFESPDGTIAYAGRLFRNRKTGVTQYNKPAQRFTEDAEARGRLVCVITSLLAPCSRWRWSSAAAHTLCAVGVWRSQ